MFIVIHHDVRGACDVRTAACVATAAKFWMRKSKQEAAATRVRIIEAASAEFRSRGIDRTGLNDLMGAAGLTHGGFYKHFESKDQVVAEASRSAINGTIDVISGRLAAGGLAGAIDNYLSAMQRDAETPVCPYTTFGTELIRASDAARDIASDGFVQLVDLIAGALDIADAKAARAGAINVLSAMFGAMLMARISAGLELSDEILATVRAGLRRS